MRKSIRILSLLMVLAMCFSLYGCDVLDDLRETRASIAEDGTIKLADGSEYMPLPECEELTPDFYNCETVYVAEEELPLLLTFFSENAFLKTEDGIFLQSYTDEAVIYYCRTDVYDNVLDRINSGFTPEVYGYWYYDYENEEENFYVLTQSQAEALSEVYRTQTAEKLPEAATLDYEYIADLMIGTKDKLFMRDTVDVCVFNGKYYVVGYDFDATSLYRVPDDLSKEFAAILKKQIESDSYWLGKW